MGSNPTLSAGLDRADRFIPARQGGTSHLQSHIVSYGGQNMLGALY